MVVLCRSVTYPRKWKQPKQSWRGAFARLVCLVSRSHFVCYKQCSFFLADATSERTHCPFALLSAQLHSMSQASSSQRGSNAQAPLQGLLNFLARSSQPGADLTPRDILSPAASPVLRRDQGDYEESARPSLLRTPQRGRFDEAPGAPSASARSRRRSSSPHSRRDRTEALAGHRPSSSATVPTDEIRLRGPGSDARGLERIGHLTEETREIRSALGTLSNKLDTTREDSAKEVEEMQGKLADLRKALSTLTAHGECTLIGQCRSGKGDCMLIGSLSHSDDHN